MLLATDVAWLIVRPRLQPGAVVIDATVGNGYDTLMLSDAVGSSGHVYGFDVQAEALARTRARLDTRLNVTLFEAGHERIAELLPREAHGHIAAVMFNLGFLPGADRRVVTNPATTVVALKSSLALICVGGLISLVTYSGHDGGAAEAEAVRALVTALPGNYSVHLTTRLNSARPAPEVVFVERLR